MDKPTRRLTQSRPIKGSSTKRRLVLSLAAMAFSSTTAFAQTVVVIDNNLSTGLKRYNPLPTNAWTPHGDAFMFTRGQGPTFGDTLFTTANDNYGVRGEYNPNGRNVSLFNFGNPSSAWTMVPNAQTVQAANGFASMGACGQKGSDGRAWKYTGFARIGMAHYVGVHRNHYGNGVPANDPNSCRSWGGDTVILKSTDNLATFNQTLNVDPAPQSSYIFKTSPDGKAKFSNFQFVQFDYNPADPANYGVAPDGYVYILSANQWNNADELYVGRVRATNMANLNVNDWTFYSDGSWVAGQAGIDAATGVFYNKNRASYAMVQYIGAPVFKYVMFNWYHPNLLQCATSWWNVGRITKWEFYEAPSVIGPWTPVADSTGKDMSYKWEDPQLDSRPPNYYGPIGAGMYMPGAINKFITSGPSSSDVWLFAAGNWQDWGNYSLITVKATFSPKLTNPGFETGSLTGWTAIGAAAASNSSAHSGTWSGVVTTGSDSISRVVTGLVPHTTYEVTGWGKTDGTDQLAIGADSFGGTVSPFLISTSTYSQGRIKFEVTGTTARIWCKKWTGTAAAYCDDLEIRNATALSNGGFETGDLANWKVSGGATAASGVGHWAPWALKLTNINDGITRRVTGLTPGASYNLVGWGRVAVAGNSVRLQVSNYNNGSGALFADFTTTTYAKKVVTFTPTSTYVNIMCFKHTGTSNGFCDDLKLIRQ